MMMMMSACTRGFMDVSEWSMYQNPVWAASSDAFHLSSCLKRKKKKKNSPADERTKLKVTLLF